MQIVGGYLDQFKDLLVDQYKSFTKGPEEPLPKEALPVIKKIKKKASAREILENADPSSRIKKIVTYAFSAMAASFAAFAGIAMLATFFAFTALATIAVAVLKVAVIIVGIAVGCFLLSKGLEYITPKLPTPLATVAIHMNSAVKELFAWMALGVFYFYDLEKRDPKIADGKNQQPMLLIHGLNLKSSAWLYYYDRLAKIAPVFTINLGKGSKVAQLKNKIKQIRQICGNDKITIIGHGDGGIAALETAYKLKKEAGMISRVVTIGSPLKGTYFPWLGFDDRVKNLRPGSKKLVNLADKMKKEKELKFFHIASETDEMVIPPSNATFEDNASAKNLTIPSCGHANLLLDDDVLNAVIRFYNE